MSIDEIATKETQASAEDEAYAEKAKREMETEVYKIASEFCRTLYPPIHELDSRQSFRKNGLDSLDSAELIFEIEHRLGVDLSPLITEITKRHNLPDKTEGNYSELSALAIAEYIASQSK